MAITNTFRNRVRVGGSGYTIFTFGGQPIVYAQQISHTSPQPVGQGAVPIHPLDEPYPVEIITPAAAGMGELVFNLYELYGHRVYERLGAQTGGGLQNPFPGSSSANPGAGSSSQSPLSGGGPFLGAVDIVDVFIKQAQADPNRLNVVKYIRPLKSDGTSPTAPYTEEYQGCIITNVVDGERIEIGTMEVLKQVTVAYRYMTRNGHGSAAWTLRDAPLGH